MRIEGGARLNSISVHNGAITKSGVNGIEIVGEETSENRVFVPDDVTNGSSTLIRESKLAGIRIAGGAARNTVHQIGVIGCAEGFVVEGPGSKDNELRAICTSGNSGAGVRFSGGCQHNHLIGELGDRPGYFNYGIVADSIFKNGGAGVVITGIDTTENEVSRYVIGTDASRFGSGDTRNGLSSVEINGGARSNSIVECIGKNRATRDITFADGGGILPPPTIISSDLRACLNNMVSAVLLRNSKRFSSNIMK